MGAQSDHRDRQLAELTAELRNAMTAVTGYLELILDAEGDRPSETRLRWVGVIERRLDALEDLIRELRALCAEVRDPGRSSSPQNSATPTQPSAK